MAKNRCTLIVAALAALALTPAHASACGWSSIDHRVSQDESGIWDPNVYRGMMVGASAPKVIAPVEQTSASDVVSARSHKSAITVDNGRPSMYCIA